MMLQTHCLVLDNLTSVNILKRPSIPAICILPMVFSNNESVSTVPFCTDIADTLGETFCHNSSSFNYSKSFRKIKTEQEKVKFNFKSQNTEIYNKDFNLD